MMETLRKNSASSGAAGAGGGLLGVLLPAAVGGLSGGMGGLMSSFLTGPGAMSKQTPVLSCSAPVDLSSARLLI